MGNGITHTFAQHGFKVSLYDLNNQSLIKGMETISKNLDRQISKGNISEADKTATLNSISIFTDLKSAVSDADLVIEAATENLDIKINIFKDLDTSCKSSAILASNTSSISITQIASATKRPEKVIGMHFMNPVPMMKLVEVIRGKQTSEETTDLVMNIALELEKVPVEVHDAPGFIANRILMPMINEAVFALHEGVSGVKEIDTVMKLGMSHPMGPLQLADFIGLDVCLAIMNVMEQGFESSKYEACPLLSKMVQAGEMGLKSGLGFYDYKIGIKEPAVNGRFVKSN
jgi:3-hydroxybutyryl-CoA dehydrogenase